MASPQLENGFTPIANELFEKIYQSDFTSRELRIILAVTRYTYGYHRKSACLSIGFLSQATNITYRHTQETVSKLIANNVLLVNKERKGIQARELQLNKDYDCWKFRGNNNIMRVSTDMPKRDMTELDMSKKGMTEKVSLEMSKPDMSTHAQNDDKEIKKKTLNTISYGYSLSREFIEYDKPGNVNDFRFNQTIQSSVTDLVNSSVTKSVNIRDDQVGQLTKTVNDQKSNSSVTNLVIPSDDQNSNKERQKTNLITNSCIGLSVFNFYENSTNNETKDYLLSYDGNSSVTISANGQLGDSHQFGVGQFGDTKNPSIDQKGDASVTDSANARLGQIGDKEIKHINKTLNKTKALYLFSQEFIEYEKTNEVNNVGFNLTTSVVDLTNGQNNITGDVNSAIPRHGQIDDKEIKHINKTLNKTSSSVCLIPDELKNLQGFVEKDQFYNTHILDST